MARIKLAYIGGGSSRAAGTMASFLEKSESFAGSEVVLIDLDPDRLEIVRRFAEGAARVKGSDISFRVSTNQREGLADCDAVLTAYRPGGFEARVLDERIPLSHGVIGQETQGPGGFFMALRSIHIMAGICDDVEAVCPDATIFNYTNPVNIVSQAVELNSDVKIASFCEGPIVFPRFIAKAAGLDPDEIDVTMVGVNHNIWSVRHLYRGGDLVAAIRQALPERLASGELSEHQRRMLQLTDAMGAIPSEYFQYYFFGDEILAELQRKPTTRSEDILSWIPDYWAHYEEQAAAAHPTLDPARSRGGIHELELALDAIDAVFNDTGAILPVNLLNRTGAAAGFGTDIVVEMPCRTSRAGFEPIPQPPLPHHLSGLVLQLAKYQAAAAQAAWDGDRHDAIAALAGHPLVRSLPKAQVIYDEMAAAQADLLPKRLQ